MQVVVSETKHSPSNGDNLRRFRPRLALGYQQDLRSLAERIPNADASDAEPVLSEAIALISDHQARLVSSGLTPDDLLPTSKYLTTLRVLRDLVTQGWKLRSDDEGIILDSPGNDALLRGNDTERKREALRLSFSFAREAQLIQPATARFISSVERRGIESLFADGAELADRLSRSGDEAAIVPQLELVEPNVRDEATGILLQDIWRYARHYWSIPYQSTPGRNMFYLVRDAAAPARPLIGIAALGNPVLGLAQRDYFYGWSVRALSERLEELSPRQQRQVAAHLYGVVSEGIAETYSADVLPENWGDDWRTTVEVLEKLEQESAAKRLDQLGEAGEERDPEYRLIKAAHSAVDRGEEETVDWMEVARTALYKRKRAGTLADLVRARGVLTDLGFSSEGGEVKRAFQSEEGVRAVEIALRRIKQQVIATSVMELITCGAVPPYREILGGKLTAMLMLSGQVVDEFREKYSGRVSLIASALAGRSVSRSTRLALITTSSLYAVGSSQYNRIKIPTEKGALAYKRIGRTDSFGTVHFAPDTIHDLNFLARAANSNRRQINNLFGEGTSPKLRLARLGIEALGLDSGAFLRHHSPRLLYGASLCSNTDEIMLGLSETPEYLMPPSASSTDDIAGYWRERWLPNRVGRQDILDSLRRQTFEGFRLGKEVERFSAEASDRRAAPVEESAAYVRDREEIVQGSEQTFIERLYRSSKSYADRLTLEELETVHVDLGVDGHLLAQAEAGRQIVVTGNPGDGKTHLIERLRPRLEELGAQVITDANACSNDEILETWRTCRKEERPFVLAINEWPLYVLRRHTQDPELSTVGAAVDEALRQVNSAQFFVAAQRPEAPKENVVVIDLSLRNLLSPSVVEAVVGRLTQDRFYEGLNEADPMLANRDALRRPQTLERLTRLLQLVGARVPHVTMRQLVGFIAFLLTGGKSATERLIAGQDTAAFSYSNLAFEGGIGPLFDAVRAVFDPARITHPMWDEKLWLGETENQDWTEQIPPGSLTLPEVERERAYRAVKRKFFFEHSNGADLLQLMPDDEGEFEDLLVLGEESGAEIVRDLVLALNRFYEPDCDYDERDRLQLWQSHRYDVRAPSVFIALHNIPHQQLRIERMRIASWVEDWLPEKQQSRQSFALVASMVNGNDIAFLETDRELYLTLCEAQRGLGRSSWSRTATRRITRFIDQINRAAESSSVVQDVRIRNVESDLDGTFEIQRKPARYKL